MTLPQHRAEREAEDAALPGMVGEHPLIKEVYRLVRRVAPTDLPVLILGETGTGKELVARAIHDLSRRAGGAFVAVNAAAIPENLFESELFGHVKGAFTGATADRSGYLLEADRGTAFLDEIGGLALGPQAKLLRAVETREFRPVGARTDRRCDFRLVAATNADLRALVGAGAFRGDLFHRLRVFALHLPPLRMRPEDIPRLARHFAPGFELHESALEALMAHDWPGNVRELRHVVEGAVVLAGRPVLDGHAVAAALNDGRPSVTAACFERTRLLQILEGAGWDTAKAAELMGVHRVTIYRRMRRLGIPVPGPRRPDAFAPPDANANGFAANGANGDEGGSAQPQA